MADDAFNAHRDSPHPPFVSPFWKGIRVGQHHGPFSSHVHVCVSTFSLRIRNWIRRIESATYCYSTWASLFFHWILACLNVFIDPLGEDQNLKSIDCHYLTNHARSTTTLQQ